VPGRCLGDVLSMESYVFEYTSESAELASMQRLLCTEVSQVSNLSLSRSLVIVLPKGTFF
jgi:hypothetical protein